MASEVETTYLERELIRVEFPSSHLVSDHGTRVGGAGKGPSPGNLLLAGLAAASVFGARKAATRQGLALTTVVARAGMSVDREGFEGPLGPLSIISHVSRRLELGGALPADVAATLVDDLGFTEALRRGVDLEETVAFTDGAGGVTQSEWQNMVVLDMHDRTASLKTGERVQVQEPTFSVHATEISPGLVVIDLPGAPMLVREEDGLGSPTPRELVLAGLGACTTIFVARNSRFQEIPVERVSVKVTSEVPADKAEPIGKIEKLTTVAGRFTSDQQARCQFFADYCCLGESMKRGLDIHTDVVVVGSEKSAAAARHSVAEFFSSNLVCDDGACCVG